MLASSLASAERRHLASLLAQYPATITIGTRTMKAARLEKRGVKYEMDGGQIQQKTIHLLVACADLPDAEIIDATTDATRGIRITHIQTGRVYQLDTGANAPDKSPQGIFWTLTGLQTTTA